MAFSRPTKAASWTAVPSSGGVDSGIAWESIVEEWRGSITREAIAEAVRLAGETFREHAHELGLEPARV